MQGEPRRGLLLPPHFDKLTFIYAAELGQISNQQQISDVC